MVDLHSRFRGALIGLAAGDALGAPVEFEPWPQHLTGMVGHGTHNLNAGEWTDDTSMALCLAESLVTCLGFDATDQMDRYVRWMREGYLSSNGRCFDVGITTGGALRYYERTGNPYAGTPGPGRAGNGSLMRLAPIPLFYYSDAAEAIRRSAESSLTTHAAPETVDACRYYGGMIWGALHGASREELLAPAYAPIAGLWEAEPLTPAIAVVAGGSFREKEPPLIQAGSYVVHSLEAALWALCSSEDFATGALLAANLGQDSDTIAAIYGQLAGAIYGEEGIPEEWRTILARRDLIEDLADQLYALATGSGGEGR